MAKKYRKNLTKAYKRKTKLMQQNDNRWQTNMSIIREEIKYQHNKLWLREQLKKDYFK